MVQVILGGSQAAAHQWQCSLQCGPEGESTFQSVQDSLHSKQMSAQTAKPQISDMHPSHQSKALLQNHGIKENKTLSEATSD